MTEARTVELPERMQAGVCSGPQDYRLEELAVPTPGPGEVLTQVAAVGICASDLKCYQGAPLFWGDEHREGYCQPPSHGATSSSGASWRWAREPGNATGWMSATWRSPRTDATESIKVTLAP